MGGKCKNNVGRRVYNKIDFLTKNKFSIAVENTRGDGCVSGKIVDSFRAGSVPIYYGDFLVDEYINPKTYTPVLGEKDINEKIDYIKRIDNDDKLYKSIMKENPIIDKNFVNKIDKDESISFLKNIFRQEKDKAYRRDNNYFDCIINRRISLTQ